MRALTNSATTALGSSRYSRIRSRHGHFRALTTPTRWQRSFSAFTTQPAASLPNRALHEVPEIVDTIDHVGILLDDVRERFRVDQRHGQLLVERVVVPVHLRQAENTGTSLVPPSRAGEAAEQNRRRRWF